MALSSQKSGLVQNLAKAGYFVFAVPIGLAIVLAIWLTAAAAYENVKFVRSTDQLLFLVETARSAAAADPGFGQGTGEDLIDDLVRRGQLPGPPIDSWNGELRAQVPIPPFMRVEAEVPVYACRRLAYFFGKDIQARELQRLEARGEKDRWMTIYDSKARIKVLDSQQVNTACGDGSYATFALTVKLR